MAACNLPLAFSAGADVDWAAMESLRIRPGNWLGPLDLAREFGREPSDGLEVDVGCGRGRFLLARAAMFPERLFLGIERLLPRLDQADRKACVAGLANIRFLYADAEYAIRYLLPPGTVAAFYVLFNDPWPKRRHRRRRMFSAVFAAAARRALRPGGLLHVATDHCLYFEEIRRLFGAQRGFAECEPFIPTEQERTDYELAFLREARRIYRCSYRKTHSEGDPDDDAH